MLAMDPLLIDADLRRPMLAQYFGLEGAVGPTNVLVGPGRGRRCRSAGSRGRSGYSAQRTPSPNPSELLGSNATAAPLSNLTEEFELGIIDTPPLLALTDAAVVAAQCDGALMVVLGPDDGSQPSTLRGQAHDTADRAVVRQQRAEPSLRRGKER
ncbi:MAG: hypothetical protein M3Y35_09985 [Actinomycetota bacterium]|nr:hypothetical protein [Actinomycetota bacterium]